MISDEQIEIPLSKKKLIFLFMAAFIFVVIGILFILKPEKHIVYPSIVFILGIGSVLFFGSISIFIILKLLDKKAGLVINNKGIIDNSSGVSAGFIPWADIEEIKFTQVVNQKFLMLIVNNPEDYLNKVKNPLKRNAVKMNYKNYGSPISISSGTLQISFENLEELLVEKMKAYKV